MYFRIEESDTLGLNSWFIVRYITFSISRKKNKKLEQTLDKPNFLLNLGFESVNIQNKSYKIRETTRTYKLILREQWN